MIRPMGKLAIAKTGCQPFCNVIARKSQEEKYDIYEDNYYELQLVKQELDKYNQLEEQIGCPLKVYCRMIKEDGVFVEKGGQMVRIVPFIQEERFWDIGDIKNNCFGNSYLLSKYKVDWWLKADKSE
jgi:hypothetical protein